MILAGIGVALSGLGIGVGIGIKLHGNGRVTRGDLVPKEMIVTKEECHRRHKSIEDKVTYTQQLLMETTTAEQQAAARAKIDAFQG